MQLVEKHLIKPGHKFYSEIDRLSFLSKNLFNSANYIYRQDFFAGRKTDATAVYHKLKNGIDYKALPAKVATEVLRQVFKAWASYYAAIREYRQNPGNFKSEPRIPKYKHKIAGRNVVGYNYQAVSKRALKKGLIHPSGTCVKLKTSVSGVDLVRFVPLTGGYKVEVIYPKEEPRQQLPSERVAAIDLGLNNLATLTSNVRELKPQLYDGKAIKAANQYANKRNAVARSQLPSSVKNSRRIEKLWRKRNDKVDYYLHLTSRGIINQLVNRKIGTLIIGWNPDFKDGINIGRVNNQKFVCIPHRRLIQQLEYKGLLAGIKVITTEESYTSKCSAPDLEAICFHSAYLGRRVKRGMFKTSSGLMVNADVNGSLNIGRKVVGDGYVPNSIEDVVVHPVRVKPYKPV